MFIGVDGCKAGWFAVSLSEGSGWTVEVFPNIAILWSQNTGADLILIDVPIGLRNTDLNERRCDKEARALLATKRKPSVFVSPCRAAVYAATEEDAKQLNMEKTNRSLSQQTLAIIPKIRQVDQLLMSNMDARLVIREVHPEVCFWAFNNGESTIHKKTDKRGIAERKEILNSVYPQAEEIFNSVCGKYLHKHVAEDDIVDAMVAAVTAREQKNGHRTIPEEPEFDEKGLPMGMVYSSLMTLNASQY
ncbi:DUF429 domain-containing protein [Chloroflexota bacterium]